MILENFRENCKKNSVVVFPEDDVRVRKAAKLLEEEEICKPIILTSPEKEKDFQEYCKKFYELRKHKGITEEQARESVKNPVTFASLMLKNNSADALVVGASLGAAEALVPIFQVLKPETGKASSHFLMIRDKEVLVFADCAVIENPDARELAEIAMRAADAAEEYGLDPRIALLSYTTRKKGYKPKLEHVAEAAEIVRKEGYVVEGEIQFDAAYVKEVAEKKGAELTIKGDANVFVFPDLTSGNITYKIAERMGGFRAIGPILQGMPRKIAYLSRGCSAQDIADAAVVLLQKGLNKKQ